MSIPLDLQHNLKKTVAQIKASVFQRDIPLRPNMEIIRRFHGIVAYVVPVERFNDDIVNIAPMLAHHGWGNGYIRVPKGHPWYKKWYDDIKCDVHGGLTYCHLENGMWCIGFDTMHYRDSLDKWPRERVIEETLYLMKQALKSQSNKKYYVKKRAVGG